MSYIRSLPLRRAVKLINKARKLEDRETMFRYYLTILPRMEKVISFEQFVEENTPRKVIIDTRSQDEIMADILKI